jgi:hypothetical protein
MLFVRQIHPCPEDINLSLAEGAFFWYGELLADAFSPPDVVLQLFGTNLTAHGMPVVSDAVVDSVFVALLPLLLSVIFFRAYQQLL